MVDITIGYVPKTKICSYNPVYQTAHEVNREAWCLVHDNDQCIRIECGPYCARLYVYDNSAQFASAKQLRDNLIGRESSAFNDHLIKRWVLENTPSDQLMEAMHEAFVNAEQRGEQRLRESFLNLLKPTN